MRDLYSKVKSVVAIPAATYSADTTPTAIDRQGFESAMISLAIGAGGITFTTSNKIEFVLTHSDDGTTYTNVADADMKGVTGITNGIILALTAAHATADVTDFGYIGAKRYLKLLADFSGTHGTGTPVSAVILFGSANINPVH
jgi:hypothetical protein